MSQELLFFFMITMELTALVLLYNYWVIPKVSKKTITRWEAKMLDGEFDVPAMLEMYTDHLMERMSEFMINFFPQLLPTPQRKSVRRMKADRLTWCREC